MGYILTSGYWLPVVSRKGMKEVCFKYICNLDFFWKSLKQIQQHVKIYSQIHRWLASCYFLYFSVYLKYWLYVGNSPNHGKALSYTTHPPGYLYDPLAACRKVENRRPLRSKTVFLSIWCIQDTPFTNTWYFFKGRKETEPYKRYTPLVGTLWLPCFGFSNYP